MNIYTAHWKNYSDDYYAPHNRKMFLYREDADKFLNDLINYNGTEKYFILEETVFNQYTPTSDYDYNDDDDYYDDPDDEPWEVLDEWFTYNDELAYYKQQEIDNMYEKHNQNSWFLGKNVIAIDSMWFTSDEIEAFRVIWQRRISHEE